jgi:hypothetical protein
MPPPPPLHSEHISALCDFIEMQCLSSDDWNVSASDIIRIYNRQEGASTRDDDIEQVVYDALSDVEDRIKHVGLSRECYPFDIGNEGLIHFKPGDETRMWCIYLFLLFATQCDMKKNRRFSGEDAAHLFELLCAEVAKRLWGGSEKDERVIAYVFGTGRSAKDPQIPDNQVQKGFVATVDELCRNLGEGGVFKKKNNAPITAKDGKLDIVVWRRFADGRPGQLIGFGQCKTGTHWPRHLPELNPDSFCDKWMSDRPAVSPIRLFFIADRSIRRWYDHCKDGGLLLDRCRIMEYCSNLPDALLDRIASWVRAAASAHSLRLP